MPPRDVMTNPSYVVRVTRAGQPTELEFAQERVTVGREVADLALHDPGCSSRHAEIRFADGKVALHDIGSTNGTWLGTQRIKQERMTPGVKFTIGTTTLELVAVKGLEEEPGRTLVMPGPLGPGVGERTDVQPPPSQSPVAASPPRAAPGSPYASGSGSARGRRVWWLAATAVAAILAFLWSRSGDDTRAPNGDDPRRPKLTSAKKATVKVVWFKGPPGPEASGGTSATTVRITPNEKEGARVGVIEEFAGGAGKQWYTAAWLAAFRGSQITGQNLIDYEFLVETGGQIDGPSAGMLITATMIAMLRGKTPRPDTTMTGTINPDGSAGPVGGIVQKMQGASKDGIKRFGFPMGARTHEDMRTGKTVDLLEAAKEFGLEAREIHDVFEAYEFLTGDRLERPTPVAEAEMELDSDTSLRLRTKNEKWRARVKGEVATLGAAARGLGAAGKVLQGPAQMADTFAKRAGEFERSDFLAAAYDSHVQAATYAAITKERARFLKAGNDVDDMVGQVQAAATVQEQLAALSSEVELLARRTTGGGQINALRSFQALVTAECYATLGAAMFEAAEPLLEQRRNRQLTAMELQELKERLEQPIVFFTVARNLLDVAADQRDFGTEEGQSPPIAPAVINRSGAAYASAAGAVLAYLESLAGNQATGDDDYLVALRAKNRVEAMAMDAGSNNLLRLAGGSLAFLKGASLVNRYYSLGGEVDENGTFSLSNRKALSAQLDLARQLAREAAQKAKARVGFVPIASRLAYQLGVARREGDDKQKIAALEAFWESAFWSELAANSPPAKN